MCYGYLHPKLINMALPPEHDQRRRRDQISESLRRIGAESPELTRLEKTAKLIEELEWSLARRTEPGPSDSPHPRRPV